jgi:hypothetical protein
MDADGLGADEEDEEASPGAALATRDIESKESAVQAT